MKIDEASVTLRAMAYLFKTDKNNEAVETLNMGSAALNSLAGLKSGFNEWADYDCYSELQKGRKEAYERAADTVDNTIKEIEKDK